jgi:ABC-2 type transport system ATP-binding protein
MIQPDRRSDATMSAVVQVAHLRKLYAGGAGVHDVSFEVAPGEIFGLLGPNGAGKSTTVESCVGLRQPDGGKVRILGLDPQRDGTAVRERIGVQLQTAAINDRLTVAEALDLFGALYPHRVPADALIEQLDLAGERRTPFAKLSGGQKQRLFIALALIHDPEVVFLDELTTGLDPHARRATWDLVRGIQSRGKTVVLTSHFMEEAERLCDRVAIVVRGRIIAQDTPANLVRNTCPGHRVSFTALDPCPADLLRALPGVRRVELGTEVSVYGDSEGLAAAVAAALGRRSIRFRDLATRQPTLEDAYLALTGDAAQPKEVV